MKRILSLLLSISMLVGILAGVDLTAQAATLTSGSCGANVTYTFDSATGTLTISGTGKMNNYNGSNDSPFYYESRIKSVVIKAGVTSIGYYAFCGCSSLASVTIPDSVTSIDYSAFEGCSSLASITIPDSVTSISGHAFDGCTGLTSVTIPDSVTSIGSFAFYGCSSLLNIDVSEYNKNYTSQDGVLFNKNKTVLVCYPAGKSGDCYTIPDSVTSIDYSAFEGCSSLASITIPDSVTSISGHAFDGCTGLTSVTIPDSVTSIGSFAFYGCSSLLNIDVSEYNKNYTSQDGVLFNKNKTVLVCYPAGKSGDCYTIPDSVTSICSYAFSGCSSLASITILNSNCEMTDAGINRKTTIQGFKRSSAIAYAESNGNPYVEIRCDQYGLQHSYTARVIKQATCTSKGTTRYACSRCGNSYDQDIAPLGGEHSYTGEVIKQATCTNKGITRYTCTRCGDSYELENLNALGHSYTGKVIKQATCTSKGTTRYTCTRCGDSYDRVDIAIDKNNHSYTGKVIKQATCTNKGITRYTCTRCGDSYELENLNALGHSYTSKVIKQPTCTDKGTTRTCSRCGDSYDEDDIAPLGGAHSYTVSVTVQPTCEKAGERKYTCTKCQDTYTEAIEPLGHSTREVQRVEPTLTTDGYYRLECQRAGCGYSNTHLLPQLTLGFNKKVSADLEPASADTYKIVMSKSGYLVFDFAGESESWSVNIYDEDNKKVQTLSPVWKEFYKKSYLQASLGSATPATGQIATLLAGTYYIEVQRVKNSTDDNYSGAYDLSIGYTAASESITETKNDIYYDAPTAKDIRLNRSYNGFLGAKFAAKTYSGKDVIHTDERDAYKIEISKGSGSSQLSLTLSTKAFAPYAPNCTVCIYNAEFELCDEFVPLTVAANEKQNEIAYLYEGVYYIAVINRDLNENDPNQAPVEYTFTTSFKPYGTFSCVNHSYKLVKTQNPTCTVNGYRSYTCKICGASYKETMPAKGHTIVYDEAIAPTCTSSGLTRGSHCSVCGAKVVAQSIVSATSHTCRHVITQATLSKDGSDAWRCTVCGKRGTTTIPQVTSIALKQTAYTYNGKVQKPSVTVKNRKGKALKYGTDYTVSYPKGMKNVGKYTVKVTLKGNYSGSKSMTYNINPKGTSVSKVKAAKKGFKVTWKKQAKQTTGYQVQYSTSSKFKSAKTVTISKNKTTSKSVSKLSAKKKYYVRVRTYKTVKVNGKNVKLYSGWSKAKSVTTKK